MWEYEINVLRVIDGDTIDARIDLGFHTHSVKRIRLYGIDTYEQRTKDLEEKEKGKLATKRLKELLKNADKVILKSHGVGKFGRCLGSLYLINDEEEKREDVSQILLAEGHGVEYFGGSRKKDKI